MPDMAIERGEKTDEPIRTRGWTHWHHLFGRASVIDAGPWSKRGCLRIEHFGLPMTSTLTLNFVELILEAQAQGGRCAWIGFS